MASLVTSVVKELTAEVEALRTGNAEQMYMAIGLTLAPVILGFANGRSVNTNVYKRKVLKQPWFAPPGWLFPIAWTLLYLSMGFASFVIFKRGGGLFTAKNMVPLGFYSAQLLLNMCWTPTFFGSGDMAGGLWIIGGLWGLIVGTMATFQPLSLLATALLAPYLAWVSFASLVNYSVVHLNGATFDVNRAQKLK